MTWPHINQYKWDEVAGWNLNPKKICLPQTTQIFNLFKIAQGFFLHREEVKSIFGSVMNSLQIAVIATTFELIFKN